jgi:hypothetical protein
VARWSRLSLSLLFCLPGQFVNSELRPPFALLVKADSEPRELKRRCSGLAGVPVDPAVLDACAALGLRGSSERAPPPKQPIV